MPAAVLTTATAAPILVSPSPGEGIATPVAFTVLPALPNGATLAALNVSGADLVWNAAAGVIYVAADNRDALRPRTITTIDPATAKVTSAVATSGSPDLLAISGDDQYLYAGFGDSPSIQRYALPTLTPDLLIPLGIGDDVPLQYAAGTEGSCSFATSMGVAPGSETTIAVVQGNGGIEPSGCGPTVVIDGATPRPVNTGHYVTTGRDITSLTWGSDATALYTQGQEGITFQPISSLIVSGTGVAFNKSSTDDVFLGVRPHFDPGTGLIYSDGGAITRPSDLAMVGNFHASGVMVPDSKLGRAYFLGQTPNQFTTNNQPAISYTLQIYDLKTQVLLDSIVIPSVIGYPNQMIRWGSSGIAFLTENGDYEGNNAPGLLYILNAPQISGAAPATSPQWLAVTPHVRQTWPSRAKARHPGVRRRE